MIRLKPFIAVLLAVILVMCLTAGCSSPDEEGEEDSGGRKVVHFLNWGDYIDTDTIAEFEEENPDIDIKLVTVPSNEEMYIVATTQGSQIDLICPSEYMTQRLIKEGRLAKLDYSRMENYKYVAGFANRFSYEGSLEYTVPYLWGTLGILYNTKMVDEPVDSWGILWDEKYKGKIFMYDSIRDTVGVTLKYLGYSMNSTDPAELDQAAEMLIKQKPLVLAYGTDELRMSMINNSGALAVVYAGDAVYSMIDNEDLDYAIPKEGSNIFVDNFCIMKQTDVYDETLRFIDFLCRPDISAANAEYNCYSCPAEGYEEYIEDEELLELGPFAPDEDEDLNNLEYYTDIGDGISLYEDVWIRIKAS